MIATDVAAFSIRPSFRLLHNIPILYYFAYFHETSVMCLSYEVMETVKPLYFKIVGPRSYIAVKVHMSIFYVYPISFMRFNGYMQERHSHSTPLIEIIA